MLERTGVDMASEPATESAQHRAELALGNDLSELERLGALVADLGVRCAWPAGIAHELELALDEIVTNVISYAYDDDGRHEILVRFAASADCVSVDVEDDGRPFDPTTAPAPAIDATIDDRPIGGLGWHLVRSVVDTLAYRREGRRNIVTITKRLAA